MIWATLRKFTWFPIFDDLQILKTDANEIKARLIEMADVLDTVAGEEAQIVTDEQAMAAEVQKILALINQLQSTAGIQPDDPRWAPLVASLNALHTALTGDTSALAAKAP